MNDDASTRKWRWRWRDSAWHFHAAESSSSSSSSSWHRSEGDDERLSTTATSPRRREKIIPTANCDRSVMLTPVSWRHDAYVMTLTLFALQSLVTGLPSLISEIALVLLGLGLLCPGFAQLPTPTICRSAWVGRSVPSVCLFVRSITKKKNKWSQSVQTWCRELFWDVQRSKVKVTGSITVFFTQMSGAFYKTNDPKVFKLGSWDILEVILFGGSKVVKDHSHQAD